jgi:hypothetical protein
LQTPNGSNFSTNINFPKNPFLNGASMTVGFMSLFLSFYGVNLALRQNTDVGQLYGILCFGFAWVSLVYGSTATNTLKV